VVVVNNPQTIDTGNALQEWLKSPACFTTLLNTIAPIIRSKAINQGIDLNAIGMDDDVNALASCLWEFLCDKQERFSDLNAVIRDKNDSLLVSIIINRFFAYCVDERRSSSPFHAYYQHMRKILSEAEGVQYLPETGGSFYAWAKNQSVTSLTKGTLPEDSFSDWPQSEIAAKDIHKKPCMIALSRFFWDEAMKRLDTECLIPIRDLTSYVAAIYGLQKPESGQLSTEYDENDCDIVSRIEDESTFYKPDRSIIEGQLEARAKRLVNFWGAKERRLFLLRFDQQLTLEDAASETGYKSAAAVDYQIKKLVSTVRDSWEQWQFGFSSGDGDSDAEQDYFFDRLINFCKSAD
jgi:hypothetical protein